jgi:mycothiol synthase
MTTSDIALRPPTFADVPAIVKLLESAAESTGLPVSGADEVERWFTSPTFDVAGNFRLAIAATGELLAYADLVDMGGEHTGFMLDLRVPPGSEGSGAAETMLQWAEERARELAEEDAGIYQAILPPNVFGRDLLEQHGFEPVRHSFEMLIDFEAEPAAPEWPEGIAVRTFEVGRDERAVWSAQQEAFRDSWEWHEQPFEEWKHFTLREDEFDPTLNFLAIEGEEVAGISLCRPKAPRREGYGWVEILGVRRQWRRRGLGIALLQQAFGEFYRRGLRGVGLGVDAESPTGATRLYERAGMRVVDRAVVYRKPVAPASARHST